MQIIGSLEITLAKSMIRGSECFTTIKKNGKHLLKSFEPHDYRQAFRKGEFPSWRWFARQRREAKGRAAVKKGGTGDVRPSERLADSS